MKIIDQHIHSKVSHDGKSSYIEYMIEAKIKKVCELTFTEHFDDYTGVDTFLKSLSIEYYRNEYEKYKDDDLVKTNFGIEIGLRPESYDLIFNTVKNNNFDFIIGSSHITCGKDMAYDKSFFDGLTSYQAIIKYFEEVLKNINLYKNEFDVYGHLDYVIRYVKKNYPDDLQTIFYKDFNEILDEILLSLIKNDKGLEINTSGLRYGVGSCHPNIEIVQRYKELNGKIITIGSDAHNYKDLASNYSDAVEMLESTGFKEIAVFHNRKPDFVKVKELK